MSFQKGEYRHDFEVYCPYNGQHQMPFSKFWFHLTKGCKDKRQIGHKYRTCPFNCFHIINVKNFDDHVRKCKFSEISQTITKQYQHLNPAARQQMIKKAQQEYADSIREMRMAVQQQFGSNDAQLQQEASNVEMIPDWKEDYEMTENSEIDDINAISIMNEEYRKDEANSSFSSEKLVD